MSFLLSRQASIPQLFKWGFVVLVGATIGRPYNKFQFIVLVVISKTGFILHDLPFSDQYIQIADNSASQNTTSDNRPENIDKPFGAAVPNQRRNQQEHRNDTKAYSQRFAQLSGAESGFKNGVVTNKQRSALSA